MNDPGIKGGKNGERLERLFETGLGALEGATLGLKELKIVHSMLTVERSSGEDERVITSEDARHAFIEIFGEEVGDEAVTH